MTTASMPTADRSYHVTMTDAAADKARQLIDRDGTSETMLRLAVQPGGCSGLRHELFFDDRRLDGDMVIDCGAVNLVVDQMSMPYVDGATIGFSDTIDKQGFTVDNPHAQHSCGCGDSFH